LRWRTSDDARKRDENLGDYVDKELWSRGFVGFRADELAGGSKKIWFLLPAVIAAAGAGAFFAIKKLRGGNDSDGGDVWERESTFAGSTAAPPTDTPSGGAYHIAQPGVHPVVAGNAGPATTASGSLAGVASPAATAPAGTCAGGRRSNLLVRDLMTSEPATVEHDADVTTAAKRMREMNVGALPVVADGKLTGMVTDRDITLSLTDGKRPPDQIKVRDVMTDVPITVSPHISVDEAARIMADHQVRRLPVVEGSRLVGIIALGDISADGAPRDAGAALEEISEPARPQR
jgi:CBS domain-containing protein